MPRRREKGVLMKNVRVYLQMSDKKAEGSPVLERSMSVM